MVETETARINRLIINGGNTGMTELLFFAAEIKEWESSSRRAEQIAGADYYEGKHDILFRERTVIGENGELQAVKNLPNNRVIDNQFALMVDQKTNYLVGKPLTVNGKNKQYVDALTAIFNRKFQRFLSYVCGDALRGGVGWVFPYYNDFGELAFKHFPAHEILPFWADDDHTILDAAIRMYPQQVWDGFTKKIVNRVEIYKPDGIWRYVYEYGTLTPDQDMGPHENYFRVETEGKPPVELNWTKIPLIAFKYNKQETPLLNRVKTLQDGINVMLSDFENAMQEDARNTILKLKNYDGENLGEFRRNLATYGAVKLQADGDLDALTVTVNADNYKAILELLKKCLIENARGYNAKDDRMASNPNQMNIQSMYSDIDLDANGMETEFQAAFEELIWFINQDLANKGKGDFTGEDVTIVFNRDMLVNESESIDNCGKSVGILSAETIIEQHPWTKDVELELERLRQEKEKAAKEAQEYAGTFPKVKETKSTPNGEE